EPAIDVHALVRAAVADLESGSVVQGGSTIAEQYVKLSLEAQGGLPRDAATKIKEATLAYELERRVGRAQILDDYLNTVYLGHGAYGVEAAAETYFGTSVDHVDLAQAALLAGLISSPTSDDPLTHPAAAMARRHTVLTHLVALKEIGAAQAAAADGEALTRTPAPGANRTPAPYFLEEVQAAVLDDPAFGKTEEERSRALFAGGLRIRTTLDPTLQADAERAVARGVPTGAGTPDAALVSLEPGTGAVRALVGGKDFWAGTPGSQVDLATQALRQSGSTFKPFVLAAAVSAGIPVSKVFSAPATISLALTGGTWDVRNYEGEPTGSMNLVEATVVSDNTVYAQLMMDVGPAAVVSTAARLGITSPLKAYPSAALGANDVNPLEMAAAYATLANDGVYNPPYYVSEIDGPDGKVLYKHSAAPQRAVSVDVARQVTAVLQQVVDQGTGVKARIGRPVAGKTGTTDNWADAWFVGATPQLVAAVWVGYSDAERPMVPPATPFAVTGGTWPAQTFQLYASSALANQPVIDFPPAPPSTEAAIAGAQGLDVPSVIGFPTQAASDELSRAGFVARTTSVPNNEYPPGYVVAQTPNGGATAPGGSVVTVEVSS
ncbi:MAG TPA: transglycosylase domain-containing protein, partial [Acidimicrobiales bacterium]|nr:transglycosylase domain-containing protein [Acidimicrobiales bacterium]